MTIDDWVGAHAFLRPLADVHGRVEAAIASAHVAYPPVPDWQDYRGEFLEGVPLIHSVDAAIDLGANASAIASVVRRLARDAGDDSFGDDMRASADELNEPGESPRRAIDWLLGDADWTPARPGSLRYVGWLVLAEALRPLVDAFALARDDESWLRRYCPACGALPAMAQLVGTDPGRRRLLSCGSCGSRWRYKRTACPFCEVESHRLASVGIDNEGGLRLDYCESCRGYLKTYVGEGDERILLADWTSLHLDLLARDRGLERKAASLYEIAGSSATA